MLLEVLVAIAVLSVSGVILLQIFAAGARNVGHGQRLAEAAAIAESQLASAAADGAAGSNSGKTDDGFSWVVQSTPIESRELTQRADPMSATLYHVEVTVSWGDPDDNGSFTLEGGSIGIVGAGR